MARGRKPIDYKTASPNNPYNNAGKKVRATSRNPTYKKVAGAVGSAASSFMNKAGLVGMAGQLGYAVGTEINNHTKAASKLAAAFSPDYDPGTYKLNKDSGQAYKTKRK